MKTITTLFFLAITSIGRADWYTIDAQGKVVAFSQYAKPGKISVFIIGGPWCAPCKMLKENLRNSHLNMNIVDIYDVQLADSYDQFKNSKGYNFWGKLESLEELPKVYITTQTTNIVASFDDKGSYSSLYERVISVVNEILENSEGFKTDLLKQPVISSSTSGANTSSKEVNTKKNKDKKKTEEIEIDSLQKVISTKRDSILILIQENDSINLQIEKFFLGSDSLRNKYFKQ